MSERAGLALALGALTVAALAPSGAGALVPQDDAGSGGDAPDEPRPGVAVESGEAYSGTTEGIRLDPEDHYAFSADQGERIVARVSGLQGCFRILDAHGNDLSGFQCTLGGVERGRATAIAPADGTYYLRYGSIQADRYAFSLGVGEAPPPPAPMDSGLRVPRGVVPPVTAATQAGEHTVVAVIDTGVNPYHEFLRAPNLTDHPSRWLDGFPRHAESVDLTLGASNYSSALQADAGTWADLSYSGHADAEGIEGEHLYTFPGTRVVAGISFGEYDSPFRGGGGARPVLDEHGHGTGSAGLAAGAGLAEADGDVLVVAVEVGQGTFESGYWWAARQPWIDVISASLGSLANAPSPPIAFGQEDAVPWATREATANGIPVLVASGNGFTQTGVGPDHCSTHTSEHTGPRWVTPIGAAEPRTGNPSSWHWVPVEAIARAPAPSLAATSVNATDPHTGTSASTPNVAGHLAKLLQEARERGLDPAPQRALDHLLHAARPADPKPALAAEPSLPGPASVADQGYGLVDGDAVDRALGTLEAGHGPEPRPAADAFFRADDRARDLLWGEHGLFMRERPEPPRVPGTDSDAGTDRDAPDGHPSDLIVDPDIVYEGAFDGWVDPRDVYGVRLEAGDSVEVALQGDLLCLNVLRPSGAEHPIESTCPVAGMTERASFEANVTGTWSLKLSGFVPNDYTFGYTVGGAAPDPSRGPPGLGN